MKKLLKNLDKAFENRIRLGIMSALVVNAKLSFNDLKDLLGITDGNLASHLKSLEAKHYIKVSKKFIGRKPNTTYAVTARGERAFYEHLNALEALINVKKK